MVREDLISSAVSFLQDPSVAASPLDKRIAFLQSKNLTQEEVDLAIARAGEPIEHSTSAPPPLPNQYSFQAPQVSRQPQRYGYGYGPYAGTPWGPPPPEPRRDWRDWFIMATVTSSVGYGLYVAAQRYIVPLIRPPTSPQLTQDKESIDASFTRAFALIDQLATDTASLKTTEEQRTEKLDSAITEINSVIAEIKAGNVRREAESRIISDQVSSIKESVPRALEGWKASGDARLDDLGAEVGSLKRLLENRVGRSSTPVQFHNNAASTSNSTSTSPPTIPQVPLPFKYTGTAPNGTSSSSPPKPHQQPSHKSTSSTPSPPDINQNNDTTTDAPAPSLPHTSSTPSLSSSLRNTGDRRAAIPAWQMAAKEKGNKTGDSTAGTGTEGEGEGDRERA